MQRYLAAVSGGLLASSCCVVQLVLNLFSVGCAGFNTVFGPYRPIFLSLAVGGLIYSFFTDFLSSPYGDVCRHDKQLSKKEHAKCDGKSEKIKRFAITATIVILLSLSPEIVGFINDNPTLLGPLGRLTSWPETTDAGELQTTIFIHVDGMGCTACVNKCINVLLGLEPHAKVHLVQSGEGHIIVPAKNADALTDERIEQAIAKASFKARVLRREAKP